MKQKRLFLFVISIFLAQCVLSQKFLKGVVFEKLKEGEHSHFSPLPNASIFWKGTTNGTTSDVNGKFKILKPDSKDLYLVVRYVGYKTDTLKIAESETEINIVLEDSKQLSEVEIKVRKESEYVDRLNPIKTEVISSAGLQRLACCNLSESFENSGTVDVSYTDAVTGAKQIQMLGLAGIYSQMLAENVPMMRGLSSSFGLSYIPGNWMESIQVSKGTSSVINGYESITGQINVEFKKPKTSEKLFLNVYGSNMGKGELNLYSAQKLSERFTSMTLFHIESQLRELDMNKDSFIDLPTNRQINVYQRLNYDVEGKICNQYGIKVFYEEKMGGQLAFNPANDKGTSNLYGVGVTTQKYELTAKHGFFLNKPGTSIGIQTTGSYHKQDSYFGLTTYNAVQKSFYGNIIYQTILGTTDHKLSTGASYIYDGYEEALAFEPVKYDFNVNESVPGAFLQYTYDHSTIWSIIAGFRADYHSEYGTFLTPRLHFKYNFSETSNIRISSGRGYRSAHVISENIGLLASSREWYFSQNLKAEEAWNYGISYTQDFHFNNDKKISVSLDVFRTDFVNQVIVDVETHLQKVFITNLHGRSYSNSYQANVVLKLIKRLEVTLVARYNDVWQTVNGNFQQKTMIAPFKGLLSVAYTTKFDKWTFDVTSRYNGQTNLPNTDANPHEFRIHKERTDGIMLFAQITRRFKHLDLYIGAENITNYVQMNPIISPANPFGQYFDSSMIWGPVIGRMFYAGLRFKIK